MPRMNAVMERWVQTCRRELLYRTLIWNQRHLLHALREFEQFYNSYRPHQEIANARPLRALLSPIPEPIPEPDAATRLRIRRRDRLGGIHHESGMPLAEIFGKHTAISMTALWHAHRPHNTTLPFHGPVAGLRLTPLFGAASCVRSNIPVTSGSARRESLSDGGVPGRGPTQSIAPYRPIRHSAELSI